MLVAGMAGSPGLLAVGTTINGGSGTRPRVSQAVLFLWDYEREEKAWEGTLDRRISAINALVVGEDGVLTVRLWAMRVLFCCF